MAVPHEGMRKSRVGRWPSCAVLRRIAKSIDIHEDILVFVACFLLDGGEGAKKETGGVGHDGGAARGDFVAGLEFIELAEGVVDVGGGAEFLDLADEGSGEVDLVKVPLMLGGVLGAKAGVGVGDRQTAKAAPRD